MKKIRDGVLKTAEKHSDKNALWVHFDDVSTDGAVTVLPYVACRHCKKVLSYDKVKGGTSHLRRHADRRTPVLPARRKLHNAGYPAISRALQSPVMSKAQSPRNVSSLSVKTYRRLKLLLEAG